MNNEMKKAQAEEDALVAKHCGADAVSVDCNKPANTLPTRESVIWLVAKTYNVTLSLAEEWLEAEFSEVTV